MNDLGRDDAAAVLDALSEPILVGDAADRVVFVNAAALRLLGYGAEELVGKPLESIIPQRCRMLGDRKVQRALLDASPRTTRVPVLRRDGVEVEVDMAVTGARIGAPDERLVVRMSRVPESTGFDAAPEHETHRLVFENAPLGIFHFDLRGIITASNDYFARIIGSSRDILIGLDMQTLPDRGIVQSVQSVLEGRRAYYEGDYKSATAAKVTPVRVDFAPILAEDGHVVGGVGIVEDITERRKAEAAVRRSEAAFRTLIEAAPDGIAVYRDGRFIYVNPALVAELACQDASELLGKLVADVIHPDDRADIDSSTETMLTTWRAIPPREKRMLRSDGQVLVVEIATLPIHFDGQPAILVQARDLTERKEMAARLAQADRMASVGTLAAGVAHEINNPLAYALGSLELCAREIQNLEVELGAGSAYEDSLHSMQECVSHAREGAERVRIIVRDLMTFSRARSESPAPVDVQPVLDASVNLAWNEIRHRARLVKSYADVPPILGDEARLGQVFVNLLVNAAQAIPEGDATSSEIRISTWQEGDQVVVEIADTGKGIPPEMLSRIFEPFYTTKPVGVGTGLGLAICHGIVGSLGGTITAASTPGKGSRFRVALPIAYEQSYPPESPDVPSTVAAVGARILIIDDEPLLGQTLRLAFQGKHEVVVTTSGREGLSRLSEDTRFDLVLCDLMMPDISGIAVYEQVEKQHPEVADRFVFMTGGAFTERAREFLEQHQGPRLEKPFDIRDVEALIHRRQAD